MWTARSRSTGSTARQPLRHRRAAVRRATSFNESFTSVDGRGRMAIASLTAGSNGLAAFAGELELQGAAVRRPRRVKLAAQRSRLATIYADRTRLNGDYRLGSRSGTFALAGDFAADSAALDPSMIAGVTEPLAAAAKTPIGPIADRHWRRDRPHRAAISTRRARSGVVNFPGGGAVRIDSADIIGPERRAGARNRRQRGDLLLAGGRAQDRRQDRDGRRRPAQWPGDASPDGGRRANERGWPSSRLTRRTARGWH